MKTQHNHTNTDRGSVLILTLITGGILVMVLSSYLVMVQTQNRSVARSQAWNSALVIAEAGVEEAMAHLNSGITTNNLAFNYWVNTGGGNYRKTNSIGDSYYMVAIKVPPAVPDPHPVIVSTGSVPGPISGPRLARIVQVKTRPRPTFNVPGAMIVQTTVNFNGNGISTDSFDSSNTNYSTGGLYDPAKARDNGHVVTMSGQTNAIKVDNGQVKGMVRSGPGGQVSVGSGGSVGDADWVNGGSKGIKPGYFKDDVNVSFPDAKLPEVPYWLTPVAGNYKINGVTYKYILNNTSPWKLSNLDDSVYVVGPDVILYVTDSISLGGNKDQIRIAPNASIRLFVGAPTATVSGQGIINETGLAKNFTYYGLPSNTALNLSANAAFVGSIYAPNANFTLGGGGRNTYDFVGASITRSATMNGHFNFHYDEGLTNTQISPGFVATSWDEL